MVESITSQNDAFGLKQAVRFDVKTALDTANAELQRLQLLYDAPLSALTKANAVLTDTISLKWIVKSLMMDKENPTNYSKIMPLINNMQRFLNNIESKSDKLTID